MIAYSDKWNKKAQEMEQQKTLPLPPIPNPDHKGKLSLQMYFRNKMK